MFRMFPVHLVREYMNVNSLGVFVRACMHTPPRETPVDPNPTNPSLINLLPITIGIEPPALRSNPS